MIVGVSARRTKHVAPAGGGAAPDPVVLIRSSAYASLPAPGNRVGTSDAANMPTIQCSTGNPAIVTADGAHDYRFLGIKFKAPTSLLQNAVVKIGGNETTLAEYPTDITLDRCIVQGDATVGGRRGVQMDAIRGAVIDSYIYDFKEDNADSQGIWAYSTPGPLKFVNNYVSAAGENVMIGGADPTYTNSVPSDIEFRRNYLYKPSAWDGAAWDVKNLLEFKNAKRVLCEGNVLENNWAQDQSGFAFLITPRNQDGNATWCNVEDITFRYNKMLNVESGVNILGADTAYQSQITERITIKHNFIKMSMAAHAGGNRRMFQYLGGHAFGEGANPLTVQITNNTGIISNTGDTSFSLAAPNGVAITGFVFKDNIVSHGDYGFTNDSTQSAATTLSNSFSGATLDYNVIIGGSTISGTTGNQFPANNAAVSFTDSANDDYSLAGGSAYKNDGSDGNDPGANWTTLNSLTQYTVTGQWGSEPATYDDASYTNAVLPTSYVNTTYAAQTGNVWTVTNSSGGSVAGTGTGNRTDCSLAYALANCQVGDIIDVLYTLTITPTTSLTLRNI